MQYVISVSNSNHYTPTAFSFNQENYSEGFTIIIVALDLVKINTAFIVGNAN